MTYWGAEYTFPFTGKRAAYPPLGLITVAALLPKDCELRLVDLNIEPLPDDLLRWADLVLVGAMIVQSRSFHEVIARAKAAGKRVVAGGPYPTTSPEVCTDADYLVLGEAEDVLPSLFAQIRSGEAPRVTKGTRPDPTRVPVARYDLLDRSAYVCMSVQFSRGCPFNCEFCDIIEIFGRIPRTKKPAQLLRELEAIRDTGYRGSLFLVDDNFIGNKRAALAAVREIGKWQRERSYPFDLFTEASVNLALETELLKVMVESGFSAVFLGIETPSPEGLKEAQKNQNLVLPLHDAVDVITRSGLEVMAGFIVGFDTDKSDAFERQREFIQSSPIPMAMVGLLTALPGTQLTHRLEREGRMQLRASGDQFGTPNFRTHLDRRELVSGYGELLASLYQPEAFYERCRRVVEQRGHSAGRLRMPSLADLRALFLSIWRHGIIGPARAAYWGLLASAIRRPHNFRRAVALAIVGEHLRRYTHEVVQPRLARELDQLPMDPEAAVSPEIAAALNGGATSAMPALPY
ncbi:MAG TPA: B12-binding domain-containing radical SAM protein [Myxococcaceae bacterium]|nr:B12-binding domain-containing radical SAM protein [Myxococcaceae bacterium]